MSSNVSMSYYIIEVDIYLSLEQMSNSSEVSEWLDFMQKKHATLIYSMRGIAVIALA